MEGIIPLCSICLVTLNNYDDEPTRLRNCGHSYHRLCVEGWIKKNALCPDCRKPTNVTDIQKDFVMIGIIDALKAISLNALISSIPTSTAQQSSSSTPPSTSPNNSSQNVSLIKRCPAFHTHPLTKVPDPKAIYPPSGQWFCNICSASAVPGSIMYHCMDCGTFDMCSSCFARGNASPVTNSSRHTHPITLSDPNIIYAKFKGKWHCNVCRKNNQPEMYHCYSCQDFDMCGTCK